MLRNWMLTISMIFSIFLNAWAQENQPIDKLFYRDISGYHGMGKATNPDKEEAVRLAKADALKRIFREIGKDELFRELFISTWPEYISLEDSKVEITGEQYTVEVMVLVDRSAVILTEESYRGEAVNRLNRTEEILNEIEKVLKDAEDSEANLRMSAAFISYRHARVRLKEAEELLRPLGDFSISSDNGNNFSAINSLVESLRFRVSAGLERLEALAREVEKDTSHRELRETFDLIAKEIYEIEEMLEKNYEIEPFYDLPGTQLYSILIEINKSLEKAEESRGKLHFLENSVPDERILLKEKINISLSDLDIFVVKLLKMKEEVELEIREPRLVRQEKARRKVERRKRIKNIASYIFLHKPIEAFAFRYTLPFEWDGESPISLSKESDWLIRSEGVFEMGFWIRGLLVHDGIELLNVVSSSFASEIGIGFFRKTLLGAGFGWDWLRKIDDIKIKDLKENYLKFFIGGVNEERNRVNWLLAVKYRIPLFWDEFILPCHMNASAEWMLRAAHILLVEGTVSTGVYPVKDYLEYLFNWQASIALRLPYPFAWGFFYKGYARAPIEGKKIGGLTYQGKWGAFIEYSL